jgi:hypothetical protein
MTEITHADVHEQLDGPFFCDYALFAGRLRHYVAKSLETLFWKAPNEFLRRFYVTGLYKEEYAAYEDMGAMVEAFLRWKKGQLPYPVEGMLRYKDDKVMLGSLFRRRKIGSPEDLFGALDLGSWVPISWTASYPKIDAKKVLRKICEFIFIDCRQSQKIEGAEAYNRIKHGLLFVPDAHAYLDSMPHIPAVIIPNPRGDKNKPYALFGLPTNDVSLQARERVVEFVQVSLRVMAGFYVIHRYPGLLLIDKKISPAEKLFDTSEMTACKEFMLQISDRPQ